MLTDNEILAACSDATQKLAPRQLPTYRSATSSLPVYRALVGVDRLRWGGSTADAGILRRNMGGLDSDPLVRQDQPSSQRRDQRVLFWVAQLGGDREQRHPTCRIDSAVTVSRTF